MSQCLRLISNSLIAIGALCATFSVPAFAIYSTDDVAAPALQISVPNFYSRRAFDPSVFAGHMAESGGRHGDAMHYYSRAALLAPYAKSGTPNAYKSFYLRKALAEGDAAKSPSQTELTNVLLRLADELWLYDPAEATGLYQRAYDLIPDSSLKREIVADCIQKSQNLALVKELEKQRLDVEPQATLVAVTKAASNQQTMQKMLGRELIAAEAASEAKDECTAKRWAQLAATESSTGNLKAAYTHAKNAIAACQPDSKNFAMDFFFLYHYMQNSKQYLHNREPARLYHLAIKRFQSTRSFDKREVLITQALLFTRYLETNQFSKASHCLSSLTRGSGRMLNVRLFEISAFDIVENALLALSAKNSDQALRLQKIFIASEKLELPKGHQRFAALLETLAKIEKTAQHSDAAVAAYSDSLKLESDFTPLALIRGVNPALVPEKAQCPEVDIDALIANSKPPKYGENKVFSLRKQLSDCEKNKDWVEADKISLKLCDIIEHQDDTHAGRQVGCIVYGQEVERTNPYISAVKARLELQKSKSALHMIRRALRNLPYLQPYELERLANASIDCGDRILAARLAESTERRLHASPESVSLLDLSPLWKRLNRPDKVAEYSGQPVPSATELAEQQHKGQDGIFCQTGI